MLGGGLWFALKRCEPCIVLHAVKARIQKLWHILMCIKRSLPTLIRCLMYGGLLLLAYMTLLLLAVTDSVELR